MTTALYFRLRLSTHLQSSSDSAARPRSACRKAQCYARGRQREPNCVLFQRRPCRYLGQGSTRPVSCRRLSNLLQRQPRVRLTTTLPVRRVPKTVDLATLYSRARAVHDSPSASRAQIADRSALLSRVQGRRVSVGASATLFIHSTKIVSILGPSTPVTKLLEQTKFRHAVKNNNILRVGPTT